MSAELERLRERWHVAARQAQAAREQARKADLAKRSAELVEAGASRAYELKVIEEGGDAE